MLTDIDDTLTTGGRLLSEAYVALERLHDAGLLVIPVTGRPAGWCDHIARMWPVDAVVGENGAFWFRHDRNAGKLFKRDFGSFWWDLYPDLKLVDYGFFWKRVAGLDDFTWWLFEKN